MFEQKDLEFPKSWCALATNVVASKYFRGHLGTPERERSVKQMIDRVADTIADWGIKDAYFATDEDAEAFRNELKDILLKQRASFNSPVWFNVGIDAHPQCSACFINSVDDTMESILTLAKTEGMLFKFGSGAGSNLSTIRSSKETLRGGGEASGPVSFMKGFDAFAGVIKSGGKTRRAAKMVILNVGPPRRRGVHRLQARGGEEGLGADRRRLRRELQRRRGVRIGLLPELEQLRARDRCVHGGASSRTRTGRPTRSRRASRSRPSRPAT